MAPDLLVVGHPLLDLIVLKDGEKLLKKYNLEPNGATLAGPEQLPMCWSFYDPYAGAHSLTSHLLATERSFKIILPR